MLFVSLATSETHRGENFLVGLYFWRQQADGNGREHLIQCLCARSEDPLPFNAGQSVRRAVHGCEGASVQECQLSRQGR